MNISYTNEVMSVMCNHMVGRAASFVSPFYFILLENLPQGKIGEKNLTLKFRT